MLRERPHHRRPVGRALRRQAGERLVPAVAAVRAVRPHQDLAVLVRALPPGTRDRRVALEAGERGLVLPQAHRHLAARVDEPDA